MYDSVCFLFTDAGVVTGAISNDEIAARSAHGHTRVVTVHVPRSDR
jgi:hypothetical protein